MRIAREVHDVAGHGFSAVAMQAGVALVVFDEQPAQAKASVEAIQATSTKALTELRAMLEAFQHRTGSDASNEDDAAAQGLRDVPGLAEEVRAAGLAVRVSVQDEVVPEAVDRVAYRVVQEALTNVLRHAGPTNAEVDVHRQRDTLVVEVLDAGTRAGEVQPGRGLSGMRSRVLAVGGELVAEPRPGGGFRVRARLPVNGSPP